MASFRKHIKAIWDTVCAVTAIIMMMTVFVLICENMIKPLALFAAMLLTLTTFSRWTTACMSIGGIALYLASWPAVDAWGTRLGMSVWMLGFGVWTIAV